MTKSYNVSYYQNAGTWRVSDQDYATKAKAVAAFNKLVAIKVTDPDACVMLSYGSDNGQGAWAGTTLASKSTYQTWVQFNASFYGKAG